MKKMLYWTTWKQGNYYLNQINARLEFKLVKSFKTIGINLYCLEINITDEILEKLFNKDLNHCEIPNYRDAILLESYHGE